MNFNNHLELEGLHAFLSPSRYHWTNYSEDKLDSTYKKFLAVQQGIQLHQFANDAINLGIKLPNSRKTLHAYVNDAIGFRMTPEQGLFYSPNCFGHADAISFRKNLLRIHDYKSGETPASIKQLEVYSAIFGLEYNIDPRQIKTVLRIYQNNDIYEHEPHPEEILRIMEKIILFDKRINKIKLGEDE